MPFKGLLSLGIGFELDGMELKIRHDFGAGAIDYRGGISIGDGTAKLNRPERQSGDEYL